MNQIVRFIFLWLYLLILINAAFRGRPWIFPENGRLVMKHLFGES